MPRKLLDRIALNTRFYFMIRYISFVLRDRKVALEGNYDKETWVATSNDIFRLIEECGGRFHITGLDRIHSCKEPVVFVSNHMSTLETMVFPGIIAPFMDVTFIVKNSLVEHGYFAPIMRARKPIIVGRTNSREDFKKVMTEGPELLAKRISIVVFPQSTRKDEFIPSEFNSLGVKLAKKANVKVFPIALKTDFWGHGKFLKNIGPIHRNKPIYIDFGKPVEVTGSGKVEHEKIIEFISSSLINWGGKVERE
ncbi:MAG: 1-acyl-sn-glycerol-3-phosphate acyltransferase [Bacteroidetes bacterium]|nr:1-acyl-sn-glycerol-3-phosphate acyltransferase [Bacteroidota bacterium]